MSFPSRPWVFVIGAAFLALATDVRGQSLPAWEVDVHAGGRVLSSNPAGGTPLVQFPIGEAIATGGGTTFTRAISSWYFGDGTKLLNDVNARFGVSGRITPLDNAVTRAIAERRERESYGVRVARYLTPRIALEVNVDYAPSKLVFTSGLAPAIEAARATFIPAWRDLLATGFVFSPNVTSTSDFVSGNGHDITTTGAVRIHLPGARGWRPYVTGGAGVIAYREKMPSATLNGQYTFMFANLFPINERDVATVSVRTKDRAAVGLAGGGVHYDFSRHHGLRADARVEFHPGRVDTVVSAVPSVTLQSPSFAIATGGLPSVQFSNSSNIGRSSSLSGPKVDDLVTFAGTGTRTRVRVTLGYVVRF